MCLEIETHRTCNHTKFRIYTIELTIKMHSMKFQKLQS
jgi:hypothetical protein